MRRLIANWTKRTERAEILRCVIIYCWESKAFGTEGEGGRGRKKKKQREIWWEELERGWGEQKNRETKERAERRSEFRVEVRLCTEQREGRMYFRERRREMKRREGMEMDGGR